MDSFLLTIFFLGVYIIIILFAADTIRCHFRCCVYARIFLQSHPFHVSVDYSFLHHFVSNLCFCLLEKIYIDSFYYKIHHAE